MTLLEMAIAVEDALAFYLIQPVIIIMLGIFLGKITEQLIMFVGHELAPKRTRVRVLAVSVSWIIYLSAIALAFASIGLFTLLLETVVTIVVVVLAAHFLLSVFDFVRNFNHFRPVQKKIPRGATITTKFGTGTVVAVQLADTHLKLKNGDDLYIPNRTMHGLKIEIEKKA